MATMNISLPETMKEFVETQVDTQGYSTTSEYFRSLVREDQKRQARERLDAALLEGIQSGASTPMSKEDWTDLRENVRRAASKRRESR